MGNFFDGKVNILSEQKLLGLINLFLISFISQLFPIKKKYIRNATLRKTTLDKWDLGVC